MIDSIELAPFVEDLTRVLENNEDIDTQDIEIELKRYLDEFDLPIDEAKRCVLKKFGGDPKLLGNGIDKTINELTLTDNCVNLLCRILFIDNKEVSVDGKTKTISYGIFGDPSGTVPFTAWHELHCEKGEVIRIYNAYVRSWRDKVQVNLGDRTHVRELPQDALPKFNNSNNGESEEYSVNAFHDGLRNVSVVMRILELNEKQINVKGEQKTIFRGIAADETGKCRFAAWSDFDLKADEVVKITGGYIRAWRGVPELQLNGGTTVEKLPVDTLPSHELLIKDRIITISKLKHIGGAVSVAVEGVILDIRPGSGLIKRCPQCNRALKNESCMVHGQVAGEFDLRVKCVLDDGTGAMSVILGKDITEHLLGLDIDACLDRAKEQVRIEVILEDLTMKLLARPVKISGTVLSDEYGLMMIGATIEFISIKIKTEACSLLNSLGIETDNEVCNHEQS